MPTPREEQRPGKPTGSGGREASALPKWRTHLSRSPACREKGRRSLEGQKLRSLALGRAWPAQLWEASVVFHSQQASSSGHVRPSLLTLHIPLHVQFRQQNGIEGPVGGGRRGGNRSRDPDKHKDFQIRVQPQTHRTWRANTDPDKMKDPRYK